MMDHVTTEHLDDLLAAGDGVKVSLFLPTERRGAETQQNPIRLKNALTEATSALEAGGMRRPEAESLLQPARSLLDDHEFWLHQEDGLALFVDSDGLRRFRVPEKLEQLVMVGNQFHVRPLFAVVDSGAVFYVLAISHDQIRLLRGTRFQVSELELEDVPQSVADALWYKDPDATLQHHSTARGTAATFHGHGLDNETSKEDLTAFFRAVDRGVVDIVHDRKAPVVLAGVEYLLPLYRDVSDLAVMEEGIAGNPELTPANDLHERAWPLVAGVFDARRIDAAERYAAAATPTTDSVPKAVEAAALGRVEALFVPKSRHTWGEFDPESVEVIESNDGSIDLYDVAAVATWRNGGEVFLVTADQIPGSGSVAALLRF